MRLVGAGGWDYFPTTETDRLRAYSKIFRFVEVNSTFYSIPKISTVRSWRRRVPADFSFSVKCNGIATHVHELRGVDETLRILRAMITICRLLRSDMLVVQTPFKVAVDEEKIGEASKTLSIVSDENIDVYWEARSVDYPEKRVELQGQMLEHGLHPVVDLSREDPPKNADQIYSRLFSPGVPEYGEAAIREIRRRVSESMANRAVLSFHGVNMYRDAAKYLEL